MIGSEDRGEVKKELAIPIAFRELFEPKRYKVYYGGRGGAKSWNVAAALLVYSLMRPERILCARELQVSIGDSVHRLLCDLISLYDLDEHFEITNTAIRGTNGAEFLFKGLRHNGTEIKSLQGVTKVWVEEAEKVSDRSWETLIPTVREKGSEIWITFNPKNITDATYQRFVVGGDNEDRIVRKVGWRENPFFPAVLEKERLRLQKEDPEAYAHVWEGEFDTRHSGAVYAKWVAKMHEEGRITNEVVWDNAFPVFTAWDLGYDDSTAIWFFQIGYGEIFLIDYYENNNEGIGHYCDVLKNKKYTYSAHYVPHDAANKVMAAGGRSIIEQAWKDHGVSMKVVPATSQMNSIEALRKTLPRCWVNKDNCKDGVDALMQYSFVYDEKLGNFKSVPRHDWSSHAADAAEIMARVWNEKTLTLEQQRLKDIDRIFHKKRKQYIKSSNDPYSVKPKFKK